MEIILTEKVPTLGNVGEVVKVSPGYARNFLIPKERAIPADKGNKARLAHVEKMLARKIETEKSAAGAVKEQLDGLTIELIRKAGVSGKLFGAITTSDLSKELAGREIEVERRLLVLDRPIKALGTYQVRAKLFGKDVEAQFSVKVERDPKQALELEKQAKLKAREKKEEEKQAALKAEAEKAEQAAEVAEASKEAPEETSEATEAQDDSLQEN